MTKPKTIAELQSRINDLNESVETKQEHLEQYRTKRASLVVNEAATAANKQAISNIDTQMAKLQLAIDNAPAEIKLLESQLTAEQTRIAQAKRDDLLEKQNSVAREIESLSQQFIEYLKKANDTNTMLVSARSAYNGLKEKTGADVLENYCHGSQQSLRMLLEVMQSQLAGNHTTPLGSASSNVRIRL